MLKNEREIQFFSRLLRYCCYLGMAWMVVVPLIGWWYEGFWLLGDSIPTWYAEFYHVPPNHHDPLLYRLKLATFTIDLLQNLFFFVIFFTLSKLLKLYQYCQLFGKKSIHYIRIIALCLILSQVVHPFSIVFFRYIWSLPSSCLLIPYQKLIEFKVIFLACLLYFFTLILEEGDYFETEYNGTV